MTLQLFSDGRWQDAAEVAFKQDSLQAGVTLSYFYDYIISVSDCEAKDINAISINAPASIVPVDYPSWPAFLDDILPVGKSRSWWLDYLNVSRSSEFEQNYALLSHACIAPIGNMRIKESLDKGSGDDSLRFSMQDVVTLQYNFLEYANEHGAAVGGAIGAGGVAPKLLLMEVNEQVFIDADFAGKPLKATPYLTKFARNTRTQRDNDILAAEGIFYQALEEILRGSIVESIDVKNMRVIKKDEQVSLWLPRFDIDVRDGIAHRLGLESIYSILNAAPGSCQDHFSVIEKIWRKIKNATSMTSEEFVKQYVARDLLNLVFGNSDNHGRNISFLKLDGDIKYAPIYDFAPMKAAPEMVTRLFKWERGCERSGEVNFAKVTDELSDLCDPQELLTFLGELASKMKVLPEMLEELGCPDEILHFPAIGFHNTKNKLVNMGVLNG